MQFANLGVQGIWKKHLGNLTPPFTMMSYGSPGSGKSTYNILFAHYLASVLQKKVLYIAKEEGTGATLQEKFTRLNAYNQNIFLSPSLPNDLNQFDVVFLDSVNEMGMEPDDLRALHTKYPAICFVYIFKSTKTGMFRGSQDFEHLVDISVKVENGIAGIEKSRYGGSGDMKVFDAK